MFKRYSQVLIPEYESIFYKVGVSKMDVWRASAIVPYSFYVDME